MAERSILAAPRRRFSSLIKAALVGWLAMAGRSAANGDATEHADCLPQASEGVF
jgi:hypothetical protein